MSIMNNVASLTAENNLNQTSMMMNQSLERLSTGYQINTGADGPAAYVISNEQLNQIAGLQTAISNTSQAVSMVQTTEGALGTISNLLTQVRSLALSSANSGADDTNALAANQSQITAALNEINQIAANTQFGTKNVLNGSAGINGNTSSANIGFVSAGSTSPTGTFAVNVTAAATKAVVTAGTNQTAALAANESLVVNGVAIQLTAGENQAAVVTTINQYTAQTGVTAQVVGGATQLYGAQYGSASSVTVQSNVAAAATSSGFGTSLLTGTGTDVAGTIGGSAATGQGNILTGSVAADQGIAVSVAANPAVNAGNTTTLTGAVGNVTTTSNALVFQIGPNANQTVSVAVQNLATSALGLNVAGNQFSSLAGINVTTQAGAEAAVSVIDAASSTVANLDAQLGAVQTDTLSENQTNLQNTLVNTTSAESAIRDTNFASETANFSQDQVLMQVGATVLQGAQQTSQLILSLAKNL
jgi:flagellin